MYIMIHFTVSNLVLVQRFTGLCSKIYVYVYLYAKRERGKKREKESNIIFGNLWQIIYLKKEFIER